MLAEITIMAGRKHPLYDPHMFLTKLIRSTNAHQLSHYLLMNNNRLSEEDKLFPYTDEALRRYDEGLNNKNDAINEVKSR